jgi:site-specific DNA-methyltransferase (adenine-specific)
MNKLINGDCHEILRKVPNGLIKCIFMDGPDNIGLNYNSYNDNKSNEEYYHWLELIILEGLSKCKLMWISYYHKHDLEIKWMLRDILRYKFPSFDVNNFIWRYSFSQYNDADCSYGYRNILRLKRFNCEIHVDAIREHSSRQLMGDARAAGKRVPDNVFDYPRVMGNFPERRDYSPTQHPVAMMEKIVKMSVKDDEIIMDLFAGTGSTLRACLKNNLNCISIEISKMNCEYIKEELGDKIELIEWNGKWTA